jgi:hypothetical protein
MRLPRMTTRRWMLAVAVVAIVIAGLIEVCRLGHLRQVYLAVAREYADEAHEIRRGDDGRSDGRMVLIRSIAGERPASLQSREGMVYLDRIARAAAYCDQLRAKYERAARYPWLPVEPDPPYRSELEADRPD